MNCWRHFELNLKPPTLKKYCLTSDLQDSASPNVFTFGVFVYTGRVVLLSSSTTKTRTLAKHGKFVYGICRATSGKKFEHSSEGHDGHLPTPSYTTNLVPRLSPLPLFSQRQKWREPENEVVTKR